MTAELAQTCWHEVSDGNGIDPNYPYCDLPLDHSGPHRYICSYPTTDGNRDDPIFHYCVLPGFHAGPHDYEF